MSLMFEDAPIYDNVHGFIKITSTEKEIINSIYFQRLREIKQLSFAYFVFPGAVHNRFSHSLGVLSIVERILNMFLIHNSENIAASDKSGDVDKVIRKLRMAALLHDIGHYPFSHLIESVYKDLQHSLRNKFDAQDEEGKDIDSSSKKLVEDDPNLIDFALKSTAHHEQLGAYIIANTRSEGGITKILLDNQFTEEDIIDISLIILGKSSTIWFSQIIHSELDADRLDYLLRDAYATGVQYGHFDFEYLVQHCRLVLDSERDIPVFVIRSSAVFTVEHFLLARYFWYAQIICDRTISIFDEMGRTIFKWLIENKQAMDFIQVLQMVEEPYSFFKFTDYYFWDRIFWVLNDKEAENLPGFEFYQKLALLIIQRKPLTRMVIPIKKGIALKDISCTLEESCDFKQTDCLRIKGCPFRDISQEQKEIDFEKVFEEVQNSLIQIGVDPSWAMKIYRDVSISKTLKDKDYDLDRDPIRILEHDEIRNLVTLPHSIITELSGSKLIIPRIYILEEHRDIINAIKVEVQEDAII